MAKNIFDKEDTHNVESINADLRHYIHGLHRRSRCFYRTLETFNAVLWLFVNAYNKFGEAKLKYRIRKNPDPNKRIEYPFSMLDFLQTARFPASTQVKQLLRQQKHDKLLKEKRALPVKKKRYFYGKKPTKKSGAFGMLPLLIALGCGAGAVKA